MSPISAILKEKKKISMQRFIASPQVRAPKNTQNLQCSKTLYIEAILSHLENKLQIMPNDVRLTWRLTKAHVSKSIGSVCYIIFTV